MTNVIEHSGADPVFHGRPTRRLSRFIHSVTHTDDAEGARFFLWHERWEPLKTAHDFAQLNRIIDSARNPVVTVPTA